MISVADAILDLAASIAIAGGLIGTGMAQQGIGAAGMGIIAEKPEKFGVFLYCDLISTLSKAVSISKINY